MDDFWCGVIFFNVFGSVQCIFFFDYIGLFRNVVYFCCNIIMIMVWNKFKLKNEVFGINLEVRNSCWDLYVI